MKALTEKEWEVRKEKDQELTARLLIFGAEADGGWA